MRRVVVVIAMALLMFGAAAGFAVDLTFWDMPWGGSEYFEAAKNVVGRFNKAHPDITVKYQSNPWENYYQTFTVAIAGGNPPDASTGAGFQQHQFAEMGEILALDSIIAEWKKEKTLDDFFPWTIQQFQYKGAQVGIPWNMDPRGIFYRTDLFQKAGVRVPKNWDEMYDAVRKLTTKDTWGVVFATSDYTGYAAFATMLFNYGGRIFDKDGKPDFANDQNVAMLNFLRKLKAEKLLPEGIGGFTGSEAKKLFLQGKAAMIVIPPDFGPDILSQPKQFSDNVDVLPVLADKTGAKKSVIFVNAIMAYAKTKHPEETKTFVKWLSENEQDLFTAGNAGPFPSRKSFYKLPFFGKDKFKSAFISKVIPTGVPENYPVPYGFPQMNAVESEMLLRDAIQTVLATDRDAKAILGDLNVKLENIMKE